jgi:tRNA nucleotidyltransferase/poly(A) polymerase
VRDFLRGHTPADYDITTNARPEQVQAVFAKTIPTGIKHGTVSVLHEGFRIEVTTYRQEVGYQDSRRPDRVEFVTELSDDLGRRDFTVNAMALDSTGHIRDPFGGQRDLADGVIRTVGDPSQRFVEDALRILRAVRFAAQLQARIEADTWDAILRLAPRLSYISIERIRDEWNKIIVDDLAAGVQLLAKARMFGFIFPAEDITKQQLGAAARFAMAAPADIGIRHAALFYKLRIGGREATILLRKLRQPNRLILHVVSVLDAILHSDPAAWTSNQWKVYLYEHGRHAAQGAFLLESLKRPTQGELLLDQLAMAVARQDIWNLQDLAVTGEDLLQQLSVSQGPLLGRLLEELVTAVLNDNVSNTKQQLLAKGRHILSVWNESNQSR